MYFYLLAGSGSAILDANHPLQPAHRLSAGLYPTSGGSNYPSIPLGATSQRYSESSIPAESTESLAPTPGSFSAGYAMSAGRYGDLRSQSNAYTPRQLPTKSNRKKWIVCFPFPFFLQGN